jgi:large subunit ribosomal protein L10e
MGLRPAKCCRKIEKPYTRQSRKKPRKGYVKGVPDKKIHRFETGNKKRKFELFAELIVENPVQIRHNALEAARISASKHLNNTVGAESYLLKVLVYPHHVIRENALATGAGADRFQTGMRKAFGKPVSTAAQVKSTEACLCQDTFYMQGGIQG